MKQRAQEEEALAAVSAHVRMRECKGVRMCAWPARHGLSADAARAGGSGAPQRAAAQARPRCRRRRNRRAAPLARPPARAQRAVSTAGGDSPHGEATWAQRLSQRWPRRGGLGVLQSCFATSLQSSRCLGVLQSCRACCSAAWACCQARPAQRCRAIFLLPLRGLRNRCPRRPQGPA